MVPERADFDGSDWNALPRIAQGSGTITVATPSLSPFVLGGPPLSTAAFGFGGTAQGGSVAVTVGLVVVEVATSAGQSASDVAAAVAAAIAADPTLAAAGITATATGPEVSTNGVVTSLVVDDPGLEALEVRFVPLAPGWGYALLAGALLAVTLAVLRSRAARPAGSPRRGPGSG